MLRRFALLVLVLILVFQISPSHGFYSNGRWATTATNPSTGSIGSPATLTWGIVPDGTTIPGLGTSNLISFLDGIYGSGPGGADLTMRPWYDGIVENAFSRWTELSGLTFKYEENDDGIPLGNLTGALGVRGDIRLGGVFIDGNGGTSAQTGFIPSADITLDTGDVAFYGDTSNNSINLRNILVHEVGHSLGLGHVDSNNSNILMEPSFNDAFDGPQIDDIRGVHQLYGDVFERDQFGEAPNNSFVTASDLGALASGQTLTIGGDAGFSAVVTPSQNEYVSIANTNDLDFFSFTIDNPANLDVVLTPTGPNYFERPTGIGSQTLTRASQQSNLEFEVYGPDGMGGTQLLATADSAGLGLTESINDLFLTDSGEYFVRISGDTNDVQLYKLSLSVVSIFPGDVDQNGTVDGADYLDIVRSFGSPYDATDLQDWQENFGAGSVVLAATAVPEPGTLGLLAAGSLGLAAMRRCKQGLQA